MLTNTQNNNLQNGESWAGGRKRKGRNRHSPLTHVCLLCNTVFPHRYAGVNRYCSLTCFNRSKRIEKPEIACKICSKAFKQRSTGTNLYCSHPCAAIGRANDRRAQHQEFIDHTTPVACACGCGNPLANKTKWDYAAGRPRRFLPHHKAPAPKVAKECPACHKTFSLAPWDAKRRTFCSRGCATKSAVISPRFTNRVEKVGRTCPVCSATYLARPREIEQGRHLTCSQACGRVLVGINRTRTNKMCPSTQRRRVLKQREPRCERCGYDNIPEILTLHHKDENRLNGEDSNLLVLCWNCHMELHFLARTGPYKRSSVQCGKKFIQSNLLSTNESNYNSTHGHSCGPPE